MFISAEHGSSAMPAASNVEVQHQSYPGPEKNARVLSERRNPSQLSSTTGTVWDRLGGSADPLLPWASGALMRSDPGAGQQPQLPPSEPHSRRRQPPSVIAAWALLGLAVARRRAAGGGHAGGRRLPGGARVCGRGARLARRRAQRVGARGRDRAPHERAQTCALGARDRPGRDRSAPLDGGRVPRRGHRRAHRAHRALLGAAGRAHRHGRGVLRAPAPRRAAARRRQGRDPRRDPARSPGR